MIIYIHNVLEGLQGPWGKRKGSNMLHSSPNHTPLSSAGSHASTHSLAGFQVGKSRKDLHKEASVSNDNNSRILVFRLKGA